MSFPLVNEFDVSGVVKLAQLIARVSVSPIQNLRLLSLYLTLWRHSDPAGKPFLPPCEAVFLLGI